MTIWTNDKKRAHWATRGAWYDEQIDLLADLRETARPLSAWLAFLASFALRVAKHGQRMCAREVERYTSGSEA